jgi:hypothetical protein
MNLSGGSENSDDIAANLITKFNCSISDSKNGITVGTDVLMHPASKQAYQDLLVLLSLYNVANPLIAIKALLVWIKTNPHGGAQSLFMLPKPLISGVISSH